MNLEKELSQYDLRIKQSESDDREPIDFSIDDDYGNTCWVWGSDPNDVEVDCDHPEQCIDWGDDDEMGECELCGAQCEWHWEKDYEGGQDRVIHGWHRPENVSGLIGRYLKELRR